MPHFCSPWHECQASRQNQLVYKSSVKIFVFYLRFGSKSIVERNGEQAMDSFDEGSGGEAGVLPLHLAGGGQAVGIWAG
jgi:hypothetical protein